MRKIKESMKKEPKAKKSREPVKNATPVTSRASRSAKIEEVKEVKVEEKPKEVVSELKKELLADWSDDEDVVEKEKVEGELTLIYKNCVYSKVSFTRTSTAAKTFTRKSWRIIAIDQKYSEKTASQ